MLKKLLLRWGITSRSRHPQNLRSGVRTASLASPEPSSCSSSESCSFSSASSYADRNGVDRRSKLVHSVKKSTQVRDAGFACSSPISSSSSCGKQFREMQTQTDDCLSPMMRRSCAYCTMPSTCAVFSPVLPYLHPNHISTCCSFDPPPPPSVCSQSLSLCYGPCLASVPPPGHHLQPMTFSPGAGCVIRHVAAQPTHHH